MKLLSENGTKNLCSGILTSLNDLESALILLFDWTQLVWGKHAWVLELWTLMVWPIKRLCYVLYTAVLQEDRAFINFSSITRKEGQEVEGSQVMRPPLLPLFAVTFICSIYVKSRNSQLVSNIVVVRIKEERWIDTLYRRASLYSRETES